MLGPLRTLISVLFVGALVWCSFTIKLGDRTFAEHADRISQTREARDLIAGTRARIQPILEEVKHRLLGEYVEAPTFAVEASPPATPSPTARPVGARLAGGASPRSADIPAATTRGPSTAESPRLPGTRRREPSLPAAHIAR
ncbi:MAG TPA: hypothetical protein PKW35_00155 [Nannocystaceae bacterium]|nr:hypothetical protein [Nannocystaceae bacterium]